MSNENAQQNTRPVFEVPTLLGVAGEFVGEIRDIASFATNRAFQTESRDALGQLGITVPSPATMARESLGKLTSGATAVALGVLMRKTNFGSNFPPLA